MPNIKYALLDTDFISKMHLIRKDSQNKLINKIITMPNFLFHCHKQVLVELMCHNVIDVKRWLEVK